MKVELNLISKEKALEISKVLENGIPSINRVLIASPKNSKDRTTSGGIILPDNAKENIPRKGVIIQSGIIEEDNWKSLLKVGNIVTYGIYAGKEVEPENLSTIDYPDLEFTVLSINEIIYIELNK